MFKRFLLVGFLSMFISSLAMANNPVEKSEDGLMVSMFVADMRENGKFKFKLNFGDKYIDYNIDEAKEYFPDLSDDLDTLVVLKDELTKETVRVFLSSAEMVATDKRITEIVAGNKVAIDAIKKDISGGSDGFANVESLVAGNENYAGLLPDVENYLATGQLLLASDDQFLNKYVETQYFLNMLLQKMLDIIISQM